MARLLTFPSDDIGFRVVVDRLAAGSEGEPIARFERRLRRWSPAAVVRRRELSFEDGETWYIYRDGEAAARRDEAWTESEGIASARWSLDGHVIWANAAWLADQSEPWDRLEGRHITSWMLPEHHAAADALLDAVIGGAHVHTVGMSILDGETTTVEFRADREGDAFRTWVRPVMVTSRWLPVVGRARLRLGVTPVNPGAADAARTAIQSVLDAPETEAAIRQVLAERLPGWRSGMISIEVRSVQSTTLASDADDDG